MIRKSVQRFSREIVRKTKTNYLRGCLPSA
jgi:hypothetical protein